MSPNLWAEDSSGGRWSVMSCSRSCTEEPWCQEFLCQCQWCSPTRKQDHPDD